MKNKIMPLALAIATSFGVTAKGWTGENAGSQLSHGTISLPHPNNTHVSLADLRQLSSKINDIAFKDLKKDTATLIDLGFIWAQAYNSVFHGGVPSLEQRHAIPDRKNIFGVSLVYLTALKNTGKRLQAEFRVLEDLKGFYPDQYQFNYNEADMRARLNYGVPVLEEILSKGWRPNAPSP